MPGILEGDAGQFELAVPLDVDLFVRVDQDVADGLIVEQRFQRPEPEDLVENFGDDLISFGRAK